MFDWNVLFIVFYEVMGVDVLFEWCICCVIGDVLMKLVVIIMFVSLVV